MEPCLHQLSQSKPFLSMFLKAGCPSFRPTNNIKALKIIHILMLLYACNIMYTASLCLEENAFELRS